MTTTYTLAPAPRFSGMTDWDCALCGHETLKNPVFLGVDNRVIAAGTGCAAVALYGRRDDARRVRREYDAVAAHAARDAEVIADRQARYTTALASFKAARAGDVDANGDPALIGARRTYHALGGSPVLGLLPDWLARVAETGRLD